jgi:polyphosphate kinase 2
VVALSAPTERERTQWYFQRYVSHLPGAGEIVLFDRSWYNRAGVERVMGFCSEADCEEFFRTVPEFERMLVRSGIILLKYWFSITDQEQNMRFLMRIHDPLKQWKLSPMDLESRRRWELYTKAKEEMIERTHIPESRWWVVEGVDKKRARLNCIHHLLQQVPYQDVPHDPIVMPDRDHKPDYTRHPVPPGFVRSGSLLARRPHLLGTRAGDENSLVSERPKRLMAVRLNTRVGRRFGLAMARSCRIGSVGALTFWRIVIFSGKPASIFPGHA